jgi:5-methylcytosine-specific restriction endonuclease McrA
VALRPCLDCGAPAPASRCAEHAPDRRPSRRPTSWSWRKLSRRARARSPFCERCGATEDLTLDHVVPLARGGASSLANAQVLCRSCNSAKGVG